MKRIRLMPSAWAAAAPVVLLAHLVRAQPQLVIDLPDNATPGTVISVPITLNGPISNFRGLSFTFQFNPSIFEVTGTGGTLVRNYAGSFMGTANTGTGSGGVATTPGFYEDYDGSQLASGTAVFNLAVLGNPIASANGLVGACTLKVKDNAVVGSSGAVSVSNVRYIDNLFFEVNLTGESESLTVSSPVVYIWPGDANNDGTVNALDYSLVLAGQNPGVFGNARASDQQGISWSAKIAPDPWATSTLGVNNRFLDCNGDGQISAADIIAVLQNFGLNH
ncbi:MAG: cohesin domain-containing protein [Bacteroidia bacterium]|nr:cohesin domain-containing protein [Bacteroidia bacterium]MDW8333510.1 cohesin domain-containing protein [Bacteroidia bacterium]